MGQLICRGLRPVSVEKGILVAEVLGYWLQCRSDHTPLLPHIHLDGMSSTARLDQSASHAELIISVCPSIDVLQTVHISIVSLYPLGVCLSGSPFDPTSLLLALRGGQGARIPHFNISIMASSKNVLTKQL